MRRKDREISDFNEKIGILEKCDVCRVAMADGDVPYVVPVNFGYSVDGGSVTLYVHCAGEGRKIDILKANPKVCVEMDCGHELVQGATDCSCTMRYESVIGSGSAVFVNDSDEKVFALSRIMRKYSQKESFSFEPALLERVAVIKIELREFSGKRHG